MHSGEELKSTKRRKRTILIPIVIAAIVIIAAVITTTVLLIESSDDEAPISKTNPCWPSGNGHEEYVNMSNSVLGVYEQAAVAVDSAPCSTVGKNILLLNGSAVDAAIAASLCNGIFNAHSMGIGGGCFITIYSRKDNKVVTIVAREQAPAAANSTMFVNKSSLLSQEGGLAIAVPGEIAGYKKAHNLYGRLPWSALFTETIAMLENGYTISSSLGQAIQEKEKEIRKYEGLGDLFINPATDALLRKGDTLKNPKLAATLRTLASDWTSFYNGSLAEDIASEIQAAGGLVTKEDMANYTAKDADPVVVSLNGMRVYSPPPPSSGVILSYILNILNGYKMNADSVATTKSSILTHHRLVEAFKFAFAERSRLGDADFVPVDEILKNLTSEALAELTRLKIWDNQTHDPSYYGGNFGNQRTHGTAHLSVIGPDGDAVAITSTVNLYFGSKIRGMKTGIIYNDIMDDFSTPGTVNYFGVPASPANFIAPRKRPLSAMCPTIVVDSNDRVRMVLGASGGTKIISTVAYAIMNDLWFGKNIKQAIDARRIHHQLYPPSITIERDFSQSTINGLTALGHNYTCEGAFSIVQGISVAQNGTIFANCDYRKGGAPDGY